MTADTGSATGSSDPPARSRRADGPSRLDVLNEAECFALLHQDNVGRVVYSDRALPAVTPVTYAVDGRAIVFRTSPSSRLALATDGAVVAFEVDQVDRGTRTGWSVVVVGVATTLASVSQELRLAALELVPWVEGDRSHLMRVVPGLVTGRRLVVRNDGHRSEAAIRD